MSTHEQFAVEEVSPTYWKATFSNGEINLIDPDTVEQLAELVTRIEQAPDLTVVVFRSANPDFFMAHWDFLSDRSRVAAMKPAPSGLHPYADNMYRLAKVPAVTISEINGRARGGGSEFVLRRSSWTSSRRSMCTSRSSSRARATSTPIRRLCGAWPQKDTRSATTRGPIKSTGSEPAPASSYTAETLSSVRPCGGRIRTGVAPRPRTTPPRTQN